MTKIIPLRLKFANAFIVLEDKVILIDTGSPKDTDLLKKAINNAGIYLGDISLIIHTHAHFDHCGSTAELKEKTNAAIAIHQADAQYLTSGDNAPIESITLFGRLLLPILARISQYKAVIPNIHLYNEFDLHPYGVNGKVIHTPGHTEGSVSIILDSGEAIVGDLIGGGKLLGLIKPEQPRYHHWYSDFPSAKESLSQIIKLNPKTLYVGHGGPLDGPTAIQYFSELLLKDGDYYEK